MLIMRGLSTHTVVELYLLAVLKSPVRTQRYIQWKQIPFELEFDLDVIKQQSLISPVETVGAAGGADFC